MTYEYAKIQSRAHRLAKMAIEAGLLSYPTVLTCKCGSAASVYDHRDSAPICVEPMCQSCNIKSGAGMYGNTDEMNDYFRMLQLELAKIIGRKSAREPCRRRQKQKMRVDDPNIFSQNFVADIVKATFSWRVK